MIHTVGPVWHGGDPHGGANPGRCLQKQSAVGPRQNNFRSIAFPAISTGVYGYPKEEAAAIAVRTVTAFLTRYNPLEASCSSVLTRKRRLSIAACWRHTPDSTE
ncbi:macro domain-containing protein [Klebsiella pneumoniae subsp. pneumoniae]|nr:macro domain-containing protein [Klebsiella pneumoniae subsp. pneumoniae]